MDNSTSSYPQHSNSEVDHIVSLQPSQESSNILTPQAVVEIGLKLPSGTRFQKTFDITSTIRQMVSWAEEESGEELGSCRLCTNEVPKKELTDWEHTLKEAGLTVRTLLYFSLP